MATPKRKASVQLCSLDDLREWIKKTGAALEPPSDQFLGRVIDRFSLWFETATNRDFLLTDWVRYYEGNGTPVLWSHVAPIADEADQSGGLPLVELYDNATKTWQTVDYDLDYLDPDGVGKLVLRSGVWLRPRVPTANYRVTLTAGFGATPEAMPDDVRNAATIGCDLILKYQGMGIHILGSQSNVDGMAWSSRTIDDAQDRKRMRFVFDVIGNYRLPRGG